MKSSIIKKILVKCTVVLCLAVQLVCVISANSITSFRILNNEKKHNSLLCRIVNYQRDYYILTPGKKLFASEEEHVLYAIQNNEIDFLTARELQLYRVIKFFKEQYVNKSDVEKVFSALVTTCYLCKYDLDAENRSTAYSALVGRESVCAGYARAVQLLLCSVGIDCIYIVNDNHAWNLVKIDGSWFHCDSTFCDRNNDRQNDCIDYSVRSERIKATLDSLDYFLMDDYEALMSRKDWNRRLYPEAVSCPEIYIQYVINNYLAE